MTILVGWLYFGMVWLLIVFVIYMHVRWKRLVDSWREMYDEARASELHWREQALAARRERARWN